MKKHRKKEAEEDQKSPKTLVRVYNIILTFDTDVSNNELSLEIDKVIEKVNLIISKQMKDSLPYIFKDDSKEPKISISYNKDD